MYTQRRDYLLDMIEQLMERVAAVLRRARGEQADLQELERECARAMDDEFAGLDRRVRGLEPRMVARVVRPAAKLRAYAVLLAAQASLEARSGREDPTLAARARRALEQVLEAVLASEPTDIDREAVRMTYFLVDDNKLTPRYLQALIELVPGD